MGCIFYIFRYLDTDIPQPCDLDYDKNWISERQSKKGRRAPYSLYSFSLWLLAIVASSYIFEDIYSGARL